VCRFAERLIHRYFKGKSGLLLALIRLQVSQEVVDLGTKLPLSANIEDEIHISSPATIITQQDWAHEAVHETNNSYRVCQRFQFDVRQHAGLFILPKPRGDGFRPLRGTNSATLPGDCPDVSRRLLESGISDAARFRR